MQDAVLFLHQRLHGGADPAKAGFEGAGGAQTRVYLHHTGKQGVVDAQHGIGQRAGVIIILRIARRHK